MIVFGKKRGTGWCALLCVICILAVLCSSVTQVYAAKKGSIYGSSVEAEKGQEVTVTFSISKNPGIWGLQGAIQYDASVMSLKAASAGSVFSASEMTMADSLSSNPFTFLATGSSISDKTSDGSILTLTFAIHEDVQPGDYTVSISVYQAINTDEEDVSVGASGARIKVVDCLHKETYLKNAVQATDVAEGYSGDIYCKKCEQLLEMGSVTPMVDCMHMEAYLKDVVEATETTEGYSGDIYCKKCDALLQTGSVTPIVVNPCQHKNKTWTMLEPVTCIKNGKAEQTCDDCGKLLQEQTVLKTGHKKGVVTGQKAPTATEEGYTGDFRCVKCNATVGKGTVIPKIDLQVLAMTAPQGDRYYRGAQTGLVFVSEAELDSFVRVEVSGTVLSEKDYTLESGSTKLTLNPTYLESLADGTYTVTVVCETGTASAQFCVAQKGTILSKALANTPMLVITVLSVLVAAGSLAYTLITGAKRNKQGRYSKHEES